MADKEQRSLTQDLGELMREHDRIIEVLPIVVFAKQQIIELN